MRRAPGLAKVVGTMVTVTGAMVMTLYKGPILEMVWSRGTNHGAPKSTDLVKKDWVRGSLMITFGSFCWSCFIILQVSYLYSQTQSFKWIGSYLRSNKKKLKRKFGSNPHTHTHRLPSRSVSQDHIMPNCYYSMTYIGPTPNLIRFVSWD